MWHVTPKITVSYYTALKPTHQCFCLHEPPLLSPPYQEVYRLDQRKDHLVQSSTMMTTTSKSKPKPKVINMQDAPEKHAASLNLPTDNALQHIPGQGWNLASTVGKSSIAAAGNGRFAAQPCGIDSIVIQKKLIPMSSIDSLHALDPDATISFSSTFDLENYVALMQLEGGYSRGKVLDLYEHFVYGFDGLTCLLNVSTWTVNHSHSSSKGLNIKVLGPKALEDGTIVMVGEAAKAIEVGDEFFMDYRLFRLPDFYLRFCAYHQFQDVRTATLLAVGHDAFLQCRRFSVWSLFTNSGIFKLVKNECTKKAAYLKAQGTVAAINDRNCKTAKLIVLCRHYTNSVMSQVDMSRGC